MDFEARLDAMALNMELLPGMIRGRAAAQQRSVQPQQQDAENIRALARIAEIHERQLSTPEGGGAQ